MKEPQISFDGKYYNIVIPMKWLQTNNFTLTLNPQAPISEEEHINLSESNLIMRNQHNKHRKIWKEKSDN